MLSEVMKARQLAENLLASAGGERRLTDVLHLGELLQRLRRSSTASMRWCAGWRSRSPSLIVSPIISSCGWRATGIWCR